jgi:hypothetical protein
VLGELNRTDPWFFPHPTSANRIRLLRAAGTLIRTFTGKLLGVEIMESIYDTWIMHTMRPPDLPLRLGGGCRACSACPNSGPIEVGCGFETWYGGQFTESWL